MIHERTVNVDSWLLNISKYHAYILQDTFLYVGFLFRCRCEHCSDQTLVGALEFRCCREVVNATGKMVFAGSIEHIKCIT